MKKLIDSILQEQVGRNLTDIDDVTHICLSFNSLKVLMEELKQLEAIQIDDYDVFADERTPTIDDLQDYLGLKILVSATKTWNDGKKFTLLKAIK